MYNNPKTVFSINGKPISGAFWGKVLRYCGGDKERASRIFLRAHMKKATDPIKWISAGLVCGGYAWNACSLETTDPLAVQAWIDKNMSAVRSGPARVNTVLAATLRQMADMAEGKINL